MRNRRRLWALLLCLGLVAALSVSAAYIVHEADHDCCGEGCPVCRMIALQIRLLFSLTLAVTALKALFVMPRNLSARAGFRRLCFALSGSLVSWKIRLDD